MVRRLVRRSTLLAAAAALVFSGVAMADGVGADGDVVTPGVQAFVDLGTVAPGATIHRDVVMTLSCSGGRHVDPGQIVTLWQAQVTVPPAGGSMTATDSTVGPVPPEWADDTGGVSACAGPMSVDSTEPSHVTIVAPSTPGLDYVFSMTFGRTFSPAGVTDALSITGLTSVTFILDVGDADTTPPTLSGVPGDLDLVTADPAGATLDYTLPTATDDRDPSPVVACDPAPGALVPVGATTITCTATDASGNQSTATFRVVVHLATARWGEPVGDAATMAVNRGRSLPLKAWAWIDGEPVSGTASFEVWSCGEPTAGPTAGPEQTVDATSRSARWMAVLDTSGLVPGCHTVRLVQDGTALGSFNLNVVDPHDGAAAKVKGRNRPS